LEDRIPTIRVPLQVSKSALTTLCVVVTLTLLGYVFPSEGQEGAPRYKSYETLAHAMPKDTMGNPDWDAAVRDGLLDPLPAIDPGVPGEPPLQLDVLFDPNVAGLEVVFSHETHTYWLSCDGCHPSITVMQAGANTITMEKIFDGEYCGRCHGTVAFATDIRARTTNRRSFFATGNTVCTTGVRPAIQAYSRCGPGLMRSPWTLCWLASPADAATTA
jgi:c(7)-type cytochrome triheme protein